MESLLDRFLLEMENLLTFKVISKLIDCAHTGSCA